MFNTGPLPRCLREQVGSQGAPLTSICGSGCCVWRASRFTRLPMPCLGRSVGLVVEQEGRGVSHALEPFTLDPSACVGEGDRFPEWSEELDRQIVPGGRVGPGPIRPRPRRGVRALLGGSERCYIRPDARRDGAIGGW